MAPQSPLLTSIILCNQLWRDDFDDQQGDDEIMIKEVSLLHERLSRWLNRAPSASPSPATSSSCSSSSCSSSSPYAKRCKAHEEKNKETTATALASAREGGNLDLTSMPVAILTHVFGFLIPKNPGYTHTHSVKWVDLSAIAVCSKRLCEMAGDDGIWRNLCERLWPWISLPDARNAWLLPTKQTTSSSAAAVPGKEKELSGFSLLGDWAKIYHRLARTSLGIEPNGYRSRWTEDYTLSFDLRDAHKDIVLYSTCGPLWHDSVSPASASLCIPYEPQHTMGKAAYLPRASLSSFSSSSKDKKQTVKGPVYGMKASDLYQGHPAMMGWTGNQGATVEERGLSDFRHYLEAAAVRDDIRMEVRIVHRPTGRAATLYNSRHRDPPSGPQGPFGKVTFRESAAGGLDEALWRPMRLAAASPFPWASVSMEIFITMGEEVSKMSPASGGATVAAAAATREAPPVDSEEGGGARIEQERRLTLIGLGMPVLHLDIRGRGLHTMHEGMTEVDPQRLLYRTLQALPWAM